MAPATEHDVKDGRRPPYCLRRRAEGPVHTDVGPWRVLPWPGGLIVTRGPQADAEQRIRSAHRAIEIREKRRRVLSSRPAPDNLRSSRDRARAPAATHATGHRPRRTQPARNNYWTGDIDEVH